MEERTFRWRRAAGLWPRSRSWRRPAAAAAAARHRRRRGGAAPRRRSQPAPAAGATGGFACENIGGEVSVYATWTGAEQDNFHAMVAPWLECTGVDDELHRPARPRHGALTAGIAGGNLPDVAGLPGPGLMQQWYADGVLLPLDFVDFAAYEAATPPGFAALGKAPDGKLAGIFTKGAVKGLIWYNTGVWQGGAPATWDELKTAAAGAATGDTKTWCIGLESGGDSGWPGTDWIEDIVLRQAGTDGLRRLGRRDHAVDRPGDQGRLRGVRRRPSRTPTAAPTTSTRPPSARPRTRCSPTRPAACSTTRPASSPTFFESEAGATRRPVRLLPVPRHRPGQLRRDRRRRPVRHVQRHARRRSR